MYECVDLVVVRDYMCINLDSQVDCVFRNADQMQPLKKGFEMAKQIKKTQQKFK